MVGRSFRCRGIGACCCVLALIYFEGTILEKPRSTIFCVYDSEILHYFSCLRMLASPVAAFGQLASAVDMVGAGLRTLAPPAAAFARPPTFTASPGGRASFPLRLQHVATYTGRRCALIGCAHTI